MVLSKMSLFKKRKSKKELSVVDINDPDTRSLFPLIKRPKGSITYEHCLVEAFPAEIYMGTAERNYYVDSYHELCLCAHYNRRVPGKYEFIPEYQFFVTKDRMCLDIYWNLGNISDEDMVIEKYTGLEEAKSSVFYQDFCDLKEEIEKGIEWKKDHKGNPYDCGFTSFQWGEKNNGEYEYTVYECPVPEREEIVQFYVNTDTGEFERMSVSKLPVSDMMRFFKDFEELNEKELHMCSFISLGQNAIPEGSAYNKEYKIIQEQMDLWNSVVFD